MTDASCYYHGVPDGTGGVTLIPKPGPMANAVRRLQRLRFRDAAMPLEPMNNLAIPYRAKAPPPRPDADTHDDEEADIPPLDADLLRLARNANGDPSILQELYDEQAARNRRRQRFNGSSNGDQQLPESSINTALNTARSTAAATTRGINRVAKLGEAVNRDQDPDENDDPDQLVEERLVGQLPPPDLGFRYVLEQSPEGVAVLMIPDTDGSDLQVNDRAYKHHLSGRDSVLVRMNQLARNRHLTRDATTLRRTIFRHVPLKPGEHLELQSNDAYPGSVDVVLVSPVPGDDLFLPMGGAKRFKKNSPEEDDDVEMAGASPRVSGERELPMPTLRDRSFRDRAMQQRAQLAAMNTANHAYWARRR